jgi:hypothetical protein
MLLLKNLYLAKMIIFYIVQIWRVKYLNGICFHGLNENGNQNII